MMKPSPVLLLALSLSVFSPIVLAAKVNVRTGVHDRYNRIVFDWPQNVAFKTVQDGNRVTIAFTGQKDTQIKPSGMAMLPFVRDFTTQETPEGVVATFMVPDKARIESFREGPKIVFDVMTMNTSPPVFPKTTPQKRDDKSVVARKEMPEKLPETPRQVLVPPTTMPQTLADRLLDKPSETALQTPSTTLIAKVVPGIVLDTGVKPAKLAMFVRGGHLWLVTDKMPGDVMPVLTAGQGGLMGAATRTDTDRASVFRFALRDISTVFFVNRDNNIWQIAVNASKPRFLDELSITKGADGVAVNGGDNPVGLPLTDPVTGEDLVIIPLRTPEAHLTTGRDYAQMRFLPTIFGAVVAKTDPRLTTTIQADNVIFGSAVHLNVSGEKDRALGLAEPKILPPFRLDVDGADNFTVQREQQETVIVGTDNTGEKARQFLELARVYVRNGFGIESLGALRVAADLLPTIAGTPDFVALHGMGSALAGHVADARDDLADNRLQALPPAPLWLGYALARNQQWPEAQMAFHSAGKAVEGLPPGLQAHVLLAHAEALLQTGHAKDSAREAARIKDDGTLLPGDKAGLAYLAAATALADGQKDQAIALYQELVKGADQLYRSKAELDLTAIQVADKTLPLDKAIEALERLRFSWRGDRLETRIIRDLGQYYVDNKQYMDGLTLWRQAAGLGYDQADTDMLTQKMQVVFNKLYVGDGIEKMSPMRAVALFERFRELTPQGADGDMAALHLADRLAAADLLDQAEATLAKQIKARPDGENVATFGAKIASWRLLNGDGAGALQILDQTVGTATMPEKLSARRLLLRARALADNRQTDEALGLLDALQSPEALSLRADINWRQNRWPDAVTALQTLVLQARDQGKIAPDGPMPPLILKMAIAMILDDNKKGMELLVAQYGDFMNKTPRAEAFNLITKPSRGSSLADIDTLTHQVGEVELFQKFLKDFGQ